MSMMIGEYFFNSMLAVKTYRFLFPYDGKRIWMKILRVLLRVQFIDLRRGIPIRQEGARSNSLEY